MDFKDFLQQTLGQRKGDKVIELGALAEKRCTGRFAFSFPARTSTGIMGETVNLSEGGLCLTLEKPLLSTFTIPIQVDFPFSSLFESHMKIVWSKIQHKDKRFLYGLKFLRLHKRELELLKDALSKHKKLNSQFVTLVEDFRSFLLQLKSKCDGYDFAHKSEKTHIKFIEKIKDGVFEKFTDHSTDIWKIVDSFDKREYLLHQKYYYKMLGNLFVDLSETNRFIHRKPLGYAGDFMLMTYFYDFFGKYLGASSYEKILNFYACNVPIAESVIDRKDFFKKKILETVHGKNPARILSIGSGPARELLELVDEGKINSLLYFDCLDFEKEAFNYVQSMLEKIDHQKRRFLCLRLINRNFLDLIKSGLGEKTFDKYDFIYSSGLFDYLTDRIGSKTIERLYERLSKDGVVIVTNVRKGEDGHRAFYELLCGWELIYRSKDELLNLARNLRDVADTRLVNFKKHNSFLFLSLKSASK